MPANGQGAAEVSALVRNRTHIARLFTTSLNHEAIGSYQLREKKRYMTRRTCNDFFASLAVPACSVGSALGRSGTDTDDAIDTKLLRIHSNNASPIAAVLYCALQPLQHPCMLSRQQPALACLWHFSSNQGSTVAEETFFCVHPLADIALGHL